MSLASQSKVMLGSFLDVVCKVECRPTWNVVFCSFIARVAMCKVVHLMPFHWLMAVGECGLFAGCFLR